MEERKVPWWRRALSYALGGIRFGFGLFSRSQNHKAIDAPEIVAGQEESPEEEDAELIEHSPELETITESVNEAEVAAVPQTPIAAEPEPGTQVDEIPEPEAEAPAVEAIEPEPAPEAVPKAITTPDPQFEPKTEASVAAVTAEEPALEAAEENPAEESHASIESAEEPAAEQEISAEPEELPEVAPAPAVHEDASVELAEEPLAEGESAAAPTVEAEAEIEVSGEEKAVLHQVAEPVKSAVQVAEVEAEPQADCVAETAVLDEPAPADEQVLELNASPVELTQPVIEEAPEETPGQPVAEEDESVGEAATLAEAEPYTEPAVEQPDQDRQDLEQPNTSMDLIEPIPEPTAESAAAEEVAPVAEAPASQAIPAEAVAEAAAGPAPTDEEPAAEPEPLPAAQHKPFIKLESRDNEADLSPFSVVVSQVYDGPLDLLLDLIRKQDIDIYDIPIARITAQFLAYVNQLKATDVDVAGEFIYTASLLIHIKSKMLLPRAPAGPEDAAEDPRRELVERLLEHERFKNAAQMLQQKQMLEAATWTNPGMREFQDDASAEPEIAADTVDLVRIFRDILERARNRPVINVQEDSVTVGQMIQFLARRLTMEDKPVALRRLLSHTRSERALIAMFLALLELVRLQAILLRQDRAFSEIFIKKHTGFDGVMNEGLANARDDWR